MPAACRRGSSLARKSRTGWGRRLSGGPSRGPVTCAAGSRRTRRGRRAPDAERTCCAAVQRARPVRRSTLGDKAGVNPPEAIRPRPSRQVAPAAYPGNPRSMTPAPIHGSARACLQLPAPTAVDPADIVSRMASRERVVRVGRGDSGAAAHQEMAPFGHTTLCRHNPDRSGLKQIRHWRILIPDALRRNAGVHGRASTTS